MLNEYIPFIVFAMDEETGRILDVLEKEEMVSSCKMDPYGTISLLFPASIVKYRSESTAMRASFFCGEFQFEFQGGTLKACASSSEELANA